MDIPKVTVNFLAGDSIWNVLRSNQDGLRYSETELDRNPQLFVYSITKSLIYQIPSAFCQVLTHPLQTAMH